MLIQLPKLWYAGHWQKAMHPAGKRKTHVISNLNVKLNLNIIVRKVRKRTCFFSYRPKRMRGSLSGRSWLWAVSLTMVPASTPAVARAANPACPHGKTSSSYHHEDLFLACLFSSCSAFCCLTILLRQEGTKWIWCKWEKWSKEQIFCCMWWLKKIPKENKCESVDLLSCAWIKQKDNRKTGNDRKADWSCSLCAT